MAGAAPILGLKALSRIARGPSVPAAGGLLLLSAWAAARFLDFEPARRWTGALGAPGLASGAEAQEERNQNYYEALLGAPGEGAPDRFLSRGGGSADRKRQAGVDARSIRGASRGEMRPLAEVVLHGRILRTNSRGMPDRERALEAAPGTIRIAFLGESWTTGWGVEAEARYPDRLAAFLDRAADGKVGYETLNFSVPGNSPVLHLRFLASRVLPFHPDVVLLVVTPSDVSRSALDAARLLHEGIDLPSPALRALADEAGARPGRTIASLDRRLAPPAARLLRTSVGEIRRACAEVGAAFAVVLVPGLLGEAKAEAERRTIASACSEASALLLDLADAFEGEDEGGLVVASWDPHPNEKAHALLERSLRRAIARSPELCARLRRRFEELDR